MLHAKCNMQSGFIPGRGTTDVVFTPGQLIENHREMQTNMHMVVIVLEKVHR